VAIGAGDIWDTDLKTTPEICGDTTIEGSKVVHHTNDRDSAVAIIDHLVENESQTALALQKETVE